MTRYTDLSTGRIVGKPYFKELASSAPPSEPPKERRIGEKEEKYEKHEKAEKHEKVEKHEKRGDRSGAIIGGTVLIAIGVVFFLAQYGVLRLRDVGGYILVVLGSLLLITAIIRFASEEHRGRAIAPLFGGIIILTIGASLLVGFREFWPLLLVIIGILVIASGLTISRRSPRP